MKVNQNVSAVISNAHLHRTENKLTASIERLSSGYKLNKAKDSPEAALYVKAGRGETPVKISWNKKWKSHCNATSKNS